MRKSIFFVSLVLVILGVTVARSTPTKTIITTSNPVGVLTLTPPVTPTEEITPTKSRNETQIIKATYDNENGMVPKKFTVKAGTTLRLEVLAKEDGIGCMGSIMIPELSEDIQGFEEGKTIVFEVTPPTPGEYLISCAMGIHHGYIIAE